MLKLKRAVRPGLARGRRSVPCRTPVASRPLEGEASGGRVAEGSLDPALELRKWFSHDPDKWPRFRARYFRELDSAPEAWRPILSAARRGTVTLVYSSHDEQHNNAVALREYLWKKRRRQSTKR